MELCPEEYYDNCANAMRSCRQCCAGGNKQGKLLYTPNDSSLSSHPYTKDANKQKRLKQAKQVEKQIIDNIARATVRSGAANGDGDCALLNGALRKEIKDRGTKASWNVTWAEYQKGKEQGIDIFAISAINPDGIRRTMYLLDESLYEELIKQVKGAYEFESVGKEV